MAAVAGKIRGWSDKSSGCGRKKVIAIGSKSGSIGSKSERRCRPEGVAEVKSAA